MNNWKVRKGITATEIHGVYLLAADREARKVCAYTREINELGAFIWKKMEDDSSYEEILAAIREEYDIPQEYDLEKDVNGFLHILRENYYLLNEEEETETEGEREKTGKKEDEESGVYNTRPSVPSWTDHTSKEGKRTGEKGGWLKRLYERSKCSVWAPVFSRLYMMISSVEYACLQTIWFLQGFRRPSAGDAELFRENVTFIIKSFERQEMAKGLCRNISRMYPGVRIILADDSKKPLETEMENVQVIRLPFNSGLGAGLHAALERAETPYIMRMDDDELLTLRTRAERELRYLMEHPEIDLIGFGHTTAIRLHSPELNFREYFRCPMTDAPLALKIPHMTRPDDNHIVLGKVANIYLARAEKVREVGYDANIKVIDHHDFFRRAAGVIVSAAALDTVVFHRHNPYDRNYNRYRSDYKDDLKYIQRRSKERKRV